VPSATTSLSSTNPFSLHDALPILNEPLRIAVLLGSGVTAGVLFAVAVSVVPALRDLAPDRYVEAHQLLGRNWCASTYRSGARSRSEEHTSELQSLRHLVCRLLLEK